MARHWASVLPMMQSGALLHRASDGLFYVDGRWGGLDDQDTRALVAAGHLRAIGDAFLRAPADQPPGPPVEGVFPALTVWQPWATLIAEDAKLWEFRGYRCPARYVGRRIAIHAGARPVRVREITMLLHRLQTGRASGTGLAPETAVPVLEAMLRDPAAVTLRAVVCVAVLGRPIQAGELGAQLGHVRPSDSDRERHEKWAWPLSSVQRLAMPAPALGKQGWWLWQAS